MFLLSLKYLLHFVVLYAHCRGLLHHKVLVLLLQSLTHPRTLSLLNCLLQSLILDTICLYSKFLALIFIIENILHAIDELVLLISLLLPIVLRGTCVIRKSDRPRRCLGKSQFLFIERNVEKDFASLIAINSKVHILMVE